MIYRGTHKIEDLYHGSLPIIYVYRGTRLVYKKDRGDEDYCCFSRGYWVNDLPWNNDFGWKN